MQSIYTTGTQQVQQLSQEEKGIQKAFSDIRNARAIVDTVTQKLNSLIYEIVYAEGFSDYTSIARLIERNPLEPIIAPFIGRLPEKTDIQRIADRLKKDTADFDAYHATAITQGLIAPVVFSIKRNIQQVKTEVKILWEMMLDDLEKTIILLGGYPGELDPDKKKKLVPVFIAIGLLIFLIAMIPGEKKEEKKKPEKSK